MSVDDPQDPNTQLIQCQETNPIEFLNGLKQTGGASNGYVNALDVPIGTLQIANLLPLPVALNQSGLIQINYTWGLNNPTLEEMQLVSHADIYHQPLSNTPISQADYVCTLYLNQPSPSHCTHQLAAQYLGIESVFKAYTYYTTSMSPNSGFGFITPPGIGQGLPFAEIASFSNTSNNVNITFNWVANNGNYNAIKRLQLYNETTQTMVHEYVSPQLNANFLNYITSNTLTDTSPANGNNTYRLNTIYWNSNVEIVFHIQSFNFNNTANNQTFPKAQISTAAFNNVSQTTYLGLSFTSGTQPLSSIASVVVTNQTNNQTLCTFSNNFALVSACEDPNPTVNVQNHYRVVTTYISGSNAQPYTHNYYHSPMVLIDIDNNNGNTGDPIANTGLSGIVHLKVKKGQKIELSWDINEFENPSDIEFVSIGKFQNGNGYTLGSQLQTNQAEDSFWSSGIDIQYLIHANYGENQKSYICDAIQF